jgi:hypothetical protein
MTMHQWPQSPFRWARIQLLGLLLLAGCASGTNTRIDGRQLAYVDPSIPRSVALVLASHRTCGRDEETCLSRQQALHELQGDFEKCISRGLRQTAPHVRLVPGAAWSGETGEGLFQNEAIDAEQEGPVIAELLTTHDLDYLVRIGVANSRSDNRLMLDGYGDASGGIWAVGQEWTKTAKIESRIYAAANGALVGELSASLSEDGRWFLPVLLVIPLPPVGWSPSVEYTSCREMGEALGRFFSGAGNDQIESPG